MTTLTQEPTPRTQADKTLTTNREGHTQYNITWPWDRGTQTIGTAAILRVKNEATSLPFTLPTLFKCGFKEIHLIDNQSTDGTLELAKQLAKQADAEHLLHTHTYPHTISRCGPEHLATPPDSIHSLTYFYNWAFSQANTTYTIKWDGDMIATPKGIELLKKRTATLPGRNIVLQIPRHPLYVKNNHEAWIDLGIRNKEPFGWGNTPNHTHAKAFDWEIPVWPENTRTRKMTTGSCLELKWIHENEFTHWTHNSHFTDARSKRKQREWHIHTMLANGKTPHVAGLIHVTSPDDTHIIDHIKTTWLPAQPHPLINTAIENHPAPRH